MFDKICQIVGWDYHVITKEQQGQVAQTLGILKEGGYTLNDLCRFGKEVWSKNYLWEKHKKHPTLSQLRAEIGKLRANAATIAQPTVLVVPEAAL